MTSASVLRAHLCHRGTASFGVHTSPPTRLASSTGHARALRAFLCARGWRPPPHAPISATLRATAQCPACLLLRTGPCGAPPRPLHFRHDCASSLGAFSVQPAAARNPPASTSARCCCYCNSRHSSGGRSHAITRHRAGLASHLRPRRHAAPRALSRPSMTLGAHPKHRQRAAAAALAAALASVCSGACWAQAPAAAAGTPLWHYAVEHELALLVRVGGWVGGRAARARPDMLLVHASARGPSPPRHTPPTGHLGGAAGPPRPQRLCGAALPGCGVPL